MRLKIKSLEAHPTPIKATSGDACYDVIATSMTYNEEQGYVEYGLGFSTEFSEEYEVTVRPRSSISKYDLVLCNSIGTIDSSYRGEWKVRFKVVPSLKVISEAIKKKKGIELSDLKIYNVGDKIAQISARKLDDLQITYVEYLSESSREGGFGSTGK